MLGAGAVAESPARTLSASRAYVTARATNAPRETPTAYESDHNGTHAPGNEPVPSSALARATAAVSTRASPASACRTDHRGHECTTKHAHRVPNRPQRHACTAQRDRAGSMSGSDGRPRHRHHGRRAGAACRTDHLGYECTAERPHGVPNRPERHACTTARRGHALVTALSTRARCVGALTTPRRRTPARAEPTTRATDAPRGTATRRTESTATARMHHSGRHHVGARRRGRHRSPARTRPSDPPGRPASYSSSRAARISSEASKLA